MSAEYSKDSRTRKSLIARVQAGDRLGWEEFYEAYRGFIHTVALWRASARGYHLSEADIADLIQNVMVGVWNKGKLSYDPERGVRFRTWLTTIVLRKLDDLVKKRIRARPDPESEEILRQQFDQACDDAWNESLKAQALALLREEVAPLDCQAFELLLKGQKPKEVAAQLKISANYVYLLKFRCAEKLQVIHAELKQDDEPAAVPHAAQPQVPLNP